MGATTDHDARTWAVACHLAALAGFLVPLGHLLGPLIVWLLKRGDDPFVDRQGKEAVNFQLSATVYAVFLILLLALSIVPLGVSTAAEPLPGPISDGPPRLLLLLLVALLFGTVVTLGWLVLVIIAAMRASQGHEYRYPLTIRWVR